MVDRPLRRSRVKWSNDRSAGREVCALAILPGDGFDVDEYHLDRRSGPTTNPLTCAMIGELFDPTAEYSIRETCKPHWSQAGAVVFMTMRCRDSIPREVVERWHRERCDWLIRKGHLDKRDPDWKNAVSRLAANEQIEFHRRFDRLREDYLDRCLGACVLRRPELAQIVGDSLLHFDGARYWMGDFIVMPNHLHFLVAFPDETRMRKQCVSWMHFTAREINRSLGTSGHVWQSDPFDHLVRSPEQYDYLRRYIYENPAKAGLKEGEFLYRRCPT